jgi:hypothetical protein
MQHGERMKYGIKTYLPAWKRVVKLSIAYQLYILSNWLESRLRVPGSFA